MSNDTLRSIVEMKICRPWIAMARQASEDTQDGFLGPTAANFVGDDWPIYVALVPGVVVGIAARIEFGTSSLRRERMSPCVLNATSTRADADDYVAVLARLELQRSPTHDPLAFPIEDLRQA